LLCIDGSEHVLTLDKVIEILKDSAVTQTVLGGITISSGCKFPIHVPKIMKVGSQ